MLKRLLATTALSCVAAFTAAHAQTSPADNAASMVKPPATPGSPAANTARPNNPDDMPVKRPPAAPAGDRMLHNNPASDAIAK
jgi:hypothetical protein